MKRSVWIPLVVLAVTAAGACSKGGKGELATRIDTGSPSPTAPAVSGQPPHGGATAAPGASKAKPSAGAGSGGAAATPLPTPGPVKAASNPAVPNHPKQGIYVYALSGSGTEVGGSRRSYPEGSESRVEFKGGPDEYSIQTSSSQDPNRRTTIRTRWEPNRVLLLQTVLSTGAGDIPCNYEPPVEIVHIPVKPETWTQTWSNQQCNGTAELTVHGMEDVAAAGRTWRTWKVSTKTTYSFGAITGTLTATEWLSPDLGTSVKGEEHNEGKFGAQPFTSDTATMLKTYP